VAPDASTPGTESIIVSLSDGQTSFVYYVQGVEGVADTGTATTTFTVSAPGFTTNSATKTIVRPGLDITGLGTSTTTLSPDDAFVVRVGVPNAGLTFLNELQAIRAGGNPITVTVTSSSPAGQLVTTPDTSRSVTVQIGVGATQSPSSVAAGGVAFDPLAEGSTTVTASNPAFATVTNGARTVTVSAPGINLSPLTVGAGLQRFWSGSLGASNHGGVDVVITSDDPAVAQVAPDATTPGATSITVPVPDGQTSFVYYVQGVEGVADTGTATTTFTVSAPGFTTNSATKTIVRPGLDITGLGTSTTTLSPDDPFVVRVGVPNAGLTFLNELQAIRAGGSPITVTVTSSSATVGQLVTSTLTSGSVTVQIGVGGTQSPSSVAAGGVAFDPLTTGSTTVTASHPAFATVTNGTRTVTVSAPGINLSPVTVGAGLQRLSNHGGVDVVITSSNPTVALVAPDASTPGTESIIVSLSDGQTTFSYYVQGVEGQTGTVTFTARASGFTDGSTTKTIVQPALDISGLNLNPTVGAADDLFVVRVGVPNGSQTFLNELQAIRAGGSALTVTVTSSDDVVGQLVTSTLTGGSVTVQIAVGATQTPSSVAAGGVAFDPLTVGSTTVTADTIGFITTTANGVRTVNVVP
jgi:hypothetical protein